MKKTRPTEQPKYETPSNSLDERNFDNTKDNEQIYVGRETAADEPSGSAAAAAASRRPLSPTTERSHTDRTQTLVGSEHQERTKTTVKLVQITDNLGAIPPIEVVQPRRSQRPPSADVDTLQRFQAEVTKQHQGKAKSKKLFFGKKSQADRKSNQRPLIIRYAIIPTRFSIGLMIFWATRVIKDGPSQGRLKKGR